MRLQFSSAAAAAACLVAFSLPADARADVDIRYTSYGVPHVKASTMFGAGKGLGYAFAAENICLFAEKIVTIRGERAFYFGEQNSYADPFAGFQGGEVNNLASDLYHRLIFTPEAAKLMRRGASRDLNELNRGFVAGYNRKLAEFGPSGLPQACRYQPWVRPISLDDLNLRHHQISLVATSNFVLPNIVAATPPGTSESVGARKAQEAAADVSRLRDARSVGSNVVALGRDATANGAGMLFGNPHFPWAGTERLYQMHLTVPGKLDIYGAGAYGQTLPFIGFNKDVAWSTTWSTDQRAVFYRLELKAGDPTSYRVGQDWRRMRSVHVQAPVRGADGKSEQRSHTFWISEFGPVLGGGPYFSWTPSTAVAIHDANRANNRWLEQFLAMSRADGVESMLASLKRLQGNPINNTAAADRSGKALYADMGIAVDVDPARIESCLDTPEAQEIYRTFFFMSLNGSDPACHPRRRIGQVQPGAVPPSDRPSLIRTDYILHSNDSHWIVNADPAARLSGFSVMIGDETLARNERTRAGMAMIADRLAGRDGWSGNRFDLDLFQTAFFRSRYLMADQGLDQVIASCRAGASEAASDGELIDLTEACAVLAKWDRTTAVNSVGSHIFREFIARLPKLNVVGLVLRPDQHDVAFDPADPINTPRGFTMDAGQRRALADAIQYLTRKGVALDRPLGELQFIVRGDRKLPLGGDPSTFHNLRPQPENDCAYCNIVYGDSYIQLVTFEGERPVARAVTTYSQSTDPASPHFADMTALYSDQRLFSVPFSDAEIAADPGFRSVRLNSQR